MQPPGEVTRLLRDARAGDRSAFDELYSLIYDELRRIAHAALRKGHSPTLQTTALVNEAYLKLLGHTDAGWENRAHFYAIVARAMRQILIDLARRRASLKRGGNRIHTALSGNDAGADVDLDELLALDEALGRLDERQRQVVEYRFFGGMAESEIAEVLGVTARTVRRDWVTARAWLYSELYDDRD